MNDAYLLLTGGIGLIMTLALLVAVRPEGAPATTDRRSKEQRRWM